MFSPSELKGEVDHSFFDSDGDGDSIRNDGRKKLDSPHTHKRQVNNNKSHTERKDESCSSQEDKRTKPSTSSSLPTTSRKAVSSYSDSEEDNNLPSDRFPERCTSTEVSIDTDSESSLSSSSGRGSFSKAKKPSLSPRGRGARAGSARSREPPSHVEESDDTVTDVSPLSSPDISPLQSLDQNHTEDEEGNLEEQQLPSAGVTNVHQDEDSDEDIDECSFTSDSNFGSKLALHYPGKRHRKNYSFRNDEVQRIDQDNQRLLHKLQRISLRPRSESAVPKNPKTAGSSPPIRPCHSAINRQRELKRIENENLAFLKRLESIKPSRGLRRSELLADYERRSGHMVAPLFPIYRSTSKNGRTASRTNSRGPRSASSAHHSSRPGSSSTPVSRSKERSTTRPPWN